MPLKLKKTLRTTLAAFECIWQEGSKIVYRIGSRKPWSFGYSAYKYDAIADFIQGSGLSCLKNRIFPPGFGCRMDERFVEYPWFFSKLKMEERIILDAGSILNHRQILSLQQLDGKKVYISTLYYEGRPDILPSPSYIYEDMRSMCFKDDFFDAICCLSTLEHVGLDNTKLYSPDQSTRENDKYSHLRAVKEMKRVLRPGGSLYLSLPYGKYKNHGWFQVFDREMVERIIREFAPTDSTATFFRYQNDQWNFSTEEACQDGTCFDIHASKQYEPDFLAFARCVICLQLTK